MECFGNLVAVAHGNSISVRTICGFPFFRSVAPPSASIVVNILNSIPFCQCLDELCVQRTKQGQNGSTQRRKFSILPLLPFRVLDQIGSKP